ncbi:ABC transporter substrate-binding protein [Bradyrhizobium sp. HKCCYLR20261]|uniref:ABC transporter substrate-binding protein n=1 Tax=unclassified Bradyrhizobium TaxID=2631580 RepID=UPI003EBA1BE7
MRTIWAGLTMLALAATPAVAESQLLFLAEDVPAGLDYDGPSVSTNTSQTGFINLSEPYIYYPYGPANSEGIRTLDYSKYEGRLVESWEFDEPSLTWTFHLRKGVKSCAGNEFTADDVLYTFARAKSVSGKAPIGWFLANLASVSGFTRDVFKPGADKSLGDAVTKVDDYTVRIKQSSPNRLFQMVMTIYSTYPYDSKEMKKHATEADPWAHDYVNTQNVPSFGAYCLERWTKDDEFVLVANPNYYRGKPAIDRVVIKKVPQSSNRTLALRSGSAQLTQRLTAREFNGLRKANGVKVAGIFGNEVLILNLNFKTPPFDNPKLRQAIAYAMPYQQITNVGYSGAAQHMDGHFSRALNAYVKPSTQYDTDLAKAKQLLAEAGYPEGKGLEAYPDAFKLAFVAERESLLGPIATVIQSSLKDIGLPVQLDPLPQTQMSDRRIVKKDLPMGLSDQEKPVGPDVGYATMLFFVSTAAGGVNNLANYSSPDVDKLFSEAKSEVDDAKRRQILTQIQERLQTDLAWVPLVETKTEWAFSSKLSGVTWHPENSIHFIDLQLQN